VDRASGGLDELRRKMMKRDENWRELEGGMDEERGSMMWHEKWRELEGGLTRRGDG